MLDDAEYEGVLLAAIDLTATAETAAGLWRWPKRPSLPDIELAQQQIANWSPEQRRHAALRVHAKEVTSGDPPGDASSRMLATIVDGSVRWTRTDLVWALRRADGRLREDGEALRLPAIVAAALPPDQLTDLVPALRAVLDHLVTVRLWPDVRRDLVALFGTAVDRATGATVSARILHTGDAFGPATRSALAETLAAPGVDALLLHCDALDTPVPSKKWLRRADELLTADGPDAVARGVPARFAASGGYVHDDTDRLLRGLSWALSRDPSAAATDLLAAVALAAAAAGPRGAGYPYAPRTAAALVEILAERDGDAPPRALARLAITVRNKNLRTRIEAALARAGQRRGWSASEVMELAVDDHGLDRDGRLTRDIGGYDASVAIIDGRARLVFSRGGTPLKGVPAAVRDGDPTTLDELRRLVTEVGRTLAAERTRVEGLLSEERTWPYPRWVARMLDHPVTGGFGRRLIWQAAAGGGGWRSGVPVRHGDRWHLDGPGGRVPVGPDDQVRLWHPALVDPAEVASWRDHVQATGLRQPFKQAFREVYLLTPAERATGTYSNRFAGHILRYRQANALMRTRGWHANFLGPWDGGYDGHATRDLGARWRAMFLHELADGDVTLGQAEHCATGQVLFQRRGDHGWAGVPVVEVPVLVFSEAMRDIDLFVGVTSIATDDRWADRTTERFYRYWHQASVGELAASAEVRRDALARILPKLKIADRCEISGRFLRVRGSRHTYKIHLGSSNILVEPHDAYLCVVPATRGNRGALWLPFDDDITLSVILSKAMLLAADDKITDPTILAQLSRN